MWQIVVACLPSPSPAPSHLHLRTHLHLHLILILIHYAVRTHGTRTIAAPDYISALTQRSGILQAAGLEVDELAHL